MLAFQIKDARDPWQGPGAWLDLMKPSKPKAKPGGRKRKGAFDEVLAARARRPAPPSEEPQPPTVSPAEEAVFRAADRAMSDPRVAAGFEVFSRFKALRKLGRDVPRSVFANALELEHFLTRLAVGLESPGDRGRLRRMRAVLLESDESRRARAVQFIETAIAENGWPSRDQLAWALAAFVDDAFEELTVDEVEDCLLQRGRKGATAIAAVLSKRCSAFGDVGEHDAITRRFEQARRALKS